MLGRKQWAPSWESHRRAGRNGRQGGKVGTEPEKVSGESGKLGPEPGKVVTEKGKVADELDKMGVEPGKVVTESEMLL